MEKISTLKECLIAGLPIRIDFDYILVFPLSAFDVCLQSAKPGSFELKGIDGNQKFYADLRLTDTPKRGKKIIQIRNLLLIGARLTVIGVTPVLTFKKADGYLRIRVSNSTFKDIRKIVS
jgi:hypothetical protein